MYGVSLDKHGIENLLRDFNALTGIRIAFVRYDYKEGISLKTEFCEFCRILRQDKRAEKNCMDCDAAAFKKADSQKGLYVYKCHAGLTEAVAPVIIDNKLLGYLMMGQVLSSLPAKRLWEKTYESCRDYDVDFRSLEEAFYKLSYMADEKITAAANIMAMGAKYIHLSKLVRLFDMPLIEKIKYYIETNLDKPISISSASKELKVSTSYLSHTLKAELGYSFTQYNLILKIEHAKQALEKTDTSVNSIAAAFGFSDANYFSRVFKKITGYSPSDYKRENSEFKSRASE